MTYTDFMLRRLWYYVSEKGSKTLVKGINLHTVHCCIDLLERQVSMVLVLYWHHRDQATLIANVSTKIC
jgi:hypothetical protein